MSYAVEQARGAVVSVRGSVVDIRFGCLPALHNLLIAGGAGDALIEVT